MMVVSIYAGEEALNPEWALVAIGLLANSFADLSSNENLVVLLTVFATLATLAAMVSGQTRNRLYAQQPRWPSASSSFSSDEGF